MHTKLPDLFHSTLPLVKHTSIQPFTKYRIKSLLINKTTAIK